MATLDIDEGVMRRLREEASRRGMTAAALAESALRRVLDAPAEAPPPSDGLPLPSWPMGPMRVDINDREAIDDLMDEEIPWLREMREETARRRAREQNE